MILNRSFQSPIKFEKREDDGHYVKLSGYALHWDTRSEVYPGAQEFFRRGAFPEETREDTRYLIKHGGLPLARVSSKTLTIREDDKGLLVEPTLDTRDPDSAGLVIKIERGDVDGQSVGFHMRNGTQKFDYSTDGEVVREITKVGKLVEVSAVTFPVHDSTLDVQQRMKEEFPEEAIKHLLRDLEAENRHKDIQELEDLRLKFNFIKNR